MGQYSIKKNQNTTLHNSLSVKMCCENEARDNDIQSLITFLEV